MRRVYQFTTGNFTTGVSAAIGHLGYSRGRQVTATSGAAYNGAMSTSLRPALAAFLVLALAVTGYVLFSQYVQGYQPCELCWRERWPWYALIALGIAGIILPSRLILALVAVTFMVSAGLGLHHAGVEQHWWAGPSACTSDNSGARSVAELKAMMLRQKQVIQCDQPTWTLFGLSMATFNFLVSLIAAVAAIVLFMRSRHASPS